MRVGDSAILTEFAPENPLQEREREPTNRVTATGIPWCPEDDRGDSRTNSRDMADRTARTCRARSAYADRATRAAGHDRSATIR
jgi:hypothetical protein